MTTDITNHRRRNPGDNGRRNRTARRGAGLLVPALFAAAAMLGGTTPAGDNTGNTKTAKADIIDTRANPDTVATRANPDTVILAPKARESLRPSFTADSLRLRAPVIGGGNTGATFADTFADTRRRMQLRLFRQLDDTMEQQAEDTIRGFSAVKHADIAIQTNLGGRKGQLAGQVIGVFDDSADHAFGWQVRAYGAEDDTRGANFGIFLRTIKGDTLVGGNIFTDYEDGDLGNFLRYGAGVEVQNPYFIADANYYIPATADKSIGNTLGSTITYSRKGYDAALRMNIPRVAFAKVRAAYYRFYGKHGAADETGFRYGMDFHPFAGFRLGVYYDEGAQDFGADIAYSYQIGEVPSRPVAGGYFTPDLFAAVSREYSQRIATVDVTPLDIRVVGVITTRMTTAARTITTTMATGGMVTITRTTMAITTTMTMTAASITTTTTMTTTIASRMASVHFIHTENSNTPFGPLVIRVSTLVKYLVTLPPPSQISGPVAITIRGNLHRAGVDTARVVSIIQNIFLPGSGTPHPSAPTVGEIRNFPSANGIFPVDIVEGSEDIISVVMTTETTMTMMGAITETTMTMAGAITETTMNIGGMTTFTTMTIAPISTTTRLTTYATTTITLTPTAIDSRSPGNKSPAGATCCSIGQARKRAAL